MEFNKELLKVRPIQTGEGDFLWKMIIKNLSDQVHPYVVRKLSFNPLTVLLTAVSITVLYYYIDMFIVSILLPVFTVRILIYIYMSSEMRKYENRFPVEKADLRGYYSRQGTAFWVATYNREIIGTVAIDKKTDSTAELKRMIVKKNYRRFGIGKMLVTTAIEFSKQQGYGELILETSEAQMPAVHLYKRCGFEIREEVFAVNVLGILTFKEFQLGMSFSRQN